MDLVGQKLGNYDLKEFLGSGGYAEVYLGMHHRLQTRVAIKVLKSPEFSPQQEQEFRKEAQIITELRHPHIIRVIDYDIWQGPGDVQRPYIVMTYAPQGNLRKAYPEGQRVPLEKISLYIKQMADALQYAHDQQNAVVHCDVKPENMLILATDNLILTDFGIAKDQHSTVEVPNLLNTQPAPPRVFGTPGYMPPERCIGGPISRSGDQYALAIVAYEWLTGYRPFDGSTSLEILTKQATLQPPSMCAKFPDISQELEDVVMKALAREIADRYPTITVFAQALEQAISAQLAHAQSNKPQTPPKQQPQPVPAPPAQARQQQPQPAPVSPEPIMQQPQPAPVPPVQVKSPPQPAQASPAQARQQQPRPAPSNSNKSPGAKASPLGNQQPGTGTGMGGNAGQQRKQSSPGKVPPVSGTARQPPQGQIFLGGNAAGNYSTVPGSQTFPSPAASPQPQSSPSGFDDFKAILFMRPFAGINRGLKRVEWLRRDPPSRFSQRPRTMFPFNNRMCIVLITLLLALFTLPYGPIICIVLGVFLYYFLGWALYLVKPRVANFFLGLLSFYYGIGLAVVCNKLLPSFPDSLGMQALLFALPAVAFLFSIYRNYRYVKLMHRQ